MKLLKLPRDMNHCGMTHSVVLTLLPRRRRGKYNSSHTSSKYEILNRSYSLLTANKNTEDEQQKYLFAIWVLQDWEGASGIAHGRPCQWKQPRLQWLSVRFLQHCLVMLLRPLCTQDTSFWACHTAVTVSWFSLASVSCTVDHFPPILACSKGKALFFTTLWKRRLRGDHQELVDLATYGTVIPLF